MKLLKEFKTPPAPATAPGAFVLRVREDAYHPYVTHWRNDEVGGYIWGHYFKTLAEAEADFDERVAREKARAIASEWEGKIL